MTLTTRMVSALLPSSWPGRPTALTAAARLDAEHGDDSLDRVLAAWSRWRESGELPTERSCGDLLLELQAFLAGGLERGGSLLPGWHPYTGADSDRLVHASPENRPSSSSLGRS